MPVMFARVVFAVLGCCAHKFPEKSEKKPCTFIIDRRLYRTLVPKDYPVSYHTSCTSVFYNFSRLTMIYFIMGFNSFIPTFLVAMSAN